MSNFSVENLATGSIIVVKNLPTLSHQWSKDWQSQRQVGYAQGIGLVVRATRTVSSYVNPHFLRAYMWNALKPFAALLLSSAFVLSCAGEDTPGGDPDCNGDINGTARVDGCGQCVGGNTGKTGCPADCNGDFFPNPEDRADYDECGNCVGGNTGDEACEPDCNGDFHEDPDDSAYIDACGNCVGGDTAALPCDCNETPGGSAFVDECGECVGGTTGLEACPPDCEGTYGGSAYTDDCGVCDADPTNDNTVDPSGAVCDVDCAGELLGTAIEDLCGICDDNPDNDNTLLPDGSPCTQDCAGIFAGPNLQDDCGVCDSDSANNNTVLPNGEACTQDCNDVWGGTATTDACGVCDNNPTNDNTLLPNGQACSMDCLGVWAGSAALDACGVCNGDGSTCADCNGTPNGSAYIDDCSECVGGTTGKVSTCNDGCDGPNTFFDDCGNCVGGSTGLSPCEPDCTGLSGGGAYRDACDVCVRGTTGLEPCVVDCNGVPGGGSFTDDCGECVGGSTGLPPCSADCSGSFDQNHVLFDCANELLVDSCDGVSECVCADLTATYYCDPDCTGTLDCAGICDGGNSLDNCGVCDADPNNDCIEDCNGVFAGPALLDDCGTCDEDPNNDCKVVAHLPGYSVIDGVIAGTKLYDTRTYQIDLDEIAPGEEAPACEPNDDNICTFTNLGLSDITDPYNPSDISFTELEYPSFDVSISDAENFLFLAAGSRGYQVVQLLTDPPYLSVLYDRDIPDVEPDDSTEPNQVFFKREGLSDEIKVVAIETRGDYTYILYSGSFTPQSQAATTPFAALEIISVTNFPTVETIGYVELGDNREAFDLALSGNYAYLAGGTDGVHVLDIAVPTSPAYLSSVSLKASFGAYALGETVASKDNVLVVTTPNGGEIFDISIPSLPTTSGSFLSTYPREVFLDDRQTSNGPVTTLFIADQSAGMSIYELDNDLTAEFRGILALNIPEEDCINPDPNAPGQCVSSAKAIKIVGNLAYIVTDMGLFVASLGF